MSRLDWRQAVTPGVALLLIGIALVFVHSGMEGERGIRALRDAEVLKVELEKELEAARAERAEIANRVQRLDERFLDLDLLDERARAVLGHVRSDEVVIRR